MKQKHAEYPVFSLENNLQRKFNAINFLKGENIFNEGNEVDGLLFIEKGKVKVYRMDSDGEEEILRIANAGDFVGYRGFLTDSKHEASAKAIENTSTILIPKKEFKDAIEW